MKLTFSILWFDDRADFLDSLDLDPLKATITSWGFLPSIKLVQTPEAFREYHPYKNFDVIAVDYNLGNYPHGEEFIRELRGHNVFTEVIFYSTASSDELWAAIRENQLEGIFVANRQTISEKIERVGYQAIHKILDLNNMRGIVMAEVGELDLLLESLLRSGMPSLGEDGQKAVYKRFEEDAFKQAKGNEGKFEAFKKNPDIEQLLSMADSAKRWSCFRSLFKRHERLKGEAIGDYQKEVLDPRNFLAHGMPNKTDNGFSFHHQGKNYEFNDNVALDLRKTMMSYREAFEKLMEKLTAEAVGA